MYKSRCRSCGLFPYYDNGAYTNHWWNGACLTKPHETSSYIPSDNVEYLEYMYEQKVKANGLM